MKNLSYLKAFFIFFGIVFLRNFLEGIFEISKEIGFDPSPFFSIQVNFSHFFIYYLFLFTGILFIFSLFLNKEVKNTLFWVLLGSFLIILVPFIDFLISKGKGFRLSYIISEPFKNFISGFNPFVKSPNISPGQKIVFLLGGVGGAFVIFYNTKNFLKTVIFPFILYLWAFFTGFIPFLISYFFKSNFLEIFKTGGLLVSDTQKYALLFFLFLQINFFVLYLYEGGNFSFLKEYEFLRDIVISITPLLTGILVFNYLLKDLFLSIFTNKFDYLLFPGFLVLSFYIALFRKSIYEENFSFSLILGTLILCFSMSFGYVFFYLIFLILFLIYISKETGFKFYPAITPIILLLSSSSIVSYTKSFLIFTPKFYIFIFLFSFLIILFEIKGEKLWILASFIYYFLPALFYFSFLNLLLFFIFFLISFFLFKFFHQLRNYLSLLYFPLIVFLLSPFSIKGENYIQNVSLTNFYFQRKDFKKVIKYIPDDSSFDFIKGISYFKIKDYDSASLYFKRHLNRKPLDMEIYSYYFYSLIGSHKILDAYEINKKALRLFSARPEILLHRGIVFLNMGLIDNAEQFFKKSLEMGYEREITYSYLGLLYLKKREFERAKFYLKKGFKIRP